MPGSPPLLTTCRAVAAHTAPEGDKATEMIARFGAFATEAEHSPLAELLATAMAVAGQKAGRVGNAANWKRHHGTDTLLPQFRAGVEAAAAAANTLLATLNEERRLTLGAMLRAFTLDSVDERRRAGELEFHDLLVFARKLLAGNEGVRRQVHQRREAITESGWHRAVA